MELAWEEVVENSAWTTKGWNACPVSASDPAQFTTNDYTKFRHPRDIPLPASDSYHQWVWCGDWCYTRWKYCKKWDRNISHWSNQQAKSARCRRRIWKRPRVRNNDETTQQSIREVVYENQRYLVKRWASPYLPRDTPHWSDANGNFKTKGVVNNNLPLNWKWIDDEWQIEVIANETDDSGWQYAADFNAVNWAPKRTILHVVRRRKCYRVRMRMKQENTVETRLIRTVSDAPSTRGKKSMDYDGTLVVSYTNQFTLAWSTHGVIESSGYQCSIWEPQLGANEYCLGYLLSAERAYPTKSFLVIIKKNGSDSDAFMRPTGLTLIWSTRFNDASSATHGHFYKPVAPKGYVALGDVVITRKKGVAVTVQDFPKLVCIKKEFVDHFDINKPHTMIWNTKKLANTNVDCQLWTQPAFSNEVESPFFVCNKLSKPLHVYPRLNIRYVLQDDPDNITVYANFMTKKGKGVGSQQRKRFFILTSEKKLLYYETAECRILKGTVDLSKMMDKCRVQQSNSERFEIPTKERKWVFTCSSSQDSIYWVNEINAVFLHPKEVVNKIIAVQIQGQPQVEMKRNEKSGDIARQLFSAPLNEQVIRLLLRNINIIKKILKGDDNNIRLSVLDEMFEPSFSKESIYKYFDDAWIVVRLLMKHFGEKRPPQIQKYVDQIPDLESCSVSYIMNNITQYVSSFGCADPLDIIKMCDACALVERFPFGRQTVVEHITDNLLSGIADKYSINICEYVVQRFDDYRKQIAVYDNVYSFFIPAKWIVPVTFSLQFCKLSGDKIDSHLKKNPEKSESVMKAKQICIENEAKLQRFAQAFLSQPHTELDCSEIQHNLPHYDGMISSILDQHLNSYISVERGKAQECVLSAKNETFAVLSEDGSLMEMYEGNIHKSCELLLVAIRTGFKKCISISRGQQLVDLLLAHQQYLGEYHDILSDLTREALETNGAIIITPSTRNDCNLQLTQRYLWFDGYYAPIGLQAIPRRDRNREDLIIQQVLTFLVLVYNSSLYCRDSMLNLGRAAHKAIESTELKKVVNFKMLHTQFESLQFAVSERLSQCIVCRIVQDLYDTYKSMNFKQMSEKDYMYLEKCRYLFESTWSNLAIQLLYIMRINQYKLMIKRCLYLLSEFAFETTLRLRNVDYKIGGILMENYKHLKASVYKHLAAESQHLASEIEDAANIVFKPCDASYDLLCSENIPIKIIINNNKLDFDLFESLYSMVADSSSDKNKEPVFYKKYTQFEMKVVEFYHSSNVVLCFKTLLLQLMESQIKLNRTAKDTVKPHLFEAFHFKDYIKPQKEDKLRLKEKLIQKIMDCKAIDKETQKKIKLLYKEKTSHDMKQEQHDSISEAMHKKTEWQSNRKESNNTDNKQVIQKMESESDEDDVIVMTQTVDIKDVDNKIVVEEIIIKNGDIQEIKAIPPIPMKPPPPPPPVIKPPIPMKPPPPKPNADQKGLFSKWFE